MRELLGKKIGENEPTFIVAEISCNHGGDHKTASELIEAAKACGADAVKIQIYSPDEMTIKSDKADFIVKEGPWQGRTLYELYTTAQTDHKLAKHMFKVANDIGIPIFASVFGKESLDFAESLGCQAYKIASFELTHVELIRAVSLINKPVILSTGMATFSQIDDAQTYMGDTPGALLHCVSSYPTSVSEANLGRIRKMRDMWPDRTIGFSDHSFGTELGPLAIACGAQILEKHLMLDTDRKVEDALFSVYPHEFKRYVQLCRRAEGAIRLQPNKQEDSSRQFRRSWYAIKDIRKGDRLTYSNIRCIRPGYGIQMESANYMWQLSATEDISLGTALTESNTNVKQA